MSVPNFDFLRKKKWVKELVKEETKEPIKERIEEPIKETIKEPIKETEQLSLNNFKKDIMEEYSESSYYFIKLIIKWKKHFIIVTVAAIAVSSFFSSEFIIKPKYKAFAIVYPANINPYGAESSTEQLLQLLQSSDIRNSIFKKFKLADRYDIDTTVKGWNARLLAAYGSNVDMKRTEYESIEIKVMDTDPQIACDIVNAIMDALNLKARTLQRSKTKEALVIISKQMNAKRYQLDSLNAFLQELRVKYQILDYNGQVKEVVKSYLKALTSGNKNGNIKDIDVMIRNLEEKGGSYYEAIQVFDAALAHYNSIRMEYENVVKDLNKELTYTNIITPPSPADKKTYPIRWLIVLASTVAANLFLLFTLALIDVRKKIIQ